MNIKIVQMNIKIVQMNMKIVLKWNSSNEKKIVQMKKKIV